MNINYKKSLKLITLLITSLLIATVSATVYSQMFLNATVGVGGLTLKWMAGTDAEITPTIVSSTCTLTGLEGIAGQTSMYNDTARIKNEGLTPVTFNITVQTCTGSIANLTSIMIKLYNVSDSTLQGTLTVWENSAKGNPLTGLEIESGSTWRLRWEITWSEQAVTSDSVDVDLVLDVSS